MWARTGNSTYWIGYEIEQLIKARVNNVERW